MKATGIVRRIDNSGRFVIPREIRKVLRIGENESLEIFISGENIVLKKYSPLLNLEKLAKKYADSLFEISNIFCIITDGDNVIAVSGLSEDKFLYKKISCELENIINGGENYVCNDKSKIINVLKDQQDDFYKMIISPIVLQDKGLGSIIMASSDENIDIEEVNIKLLQNISIFISKQLIFL